MISKFKPLGLATIAVLAMSALVVSAAQAQFTSNAAPTTVTATSELGNDVFKVDGSSVECAGHFEGTLGETSMASITIRASYTNCKAFGFAHATVDMNGCDYVFYTTEYLDVRCHAYENNETVEKGPIKIVASTCEVQIPAQTGRSQVNMTNHHPHIDAKAEVVLISANRTKDGFLCPLTGTGHVSNASYSQAAAIHVTPVSGGTTISTDWPV